MRTAVANLAGVAVYVVAVVCAGEGAQGWGEVLAFQLVILLLSHEVWYRCLNTLGVADVLYRELKRRGSELPAVGRWSYRLSALCLLVAPPALYAVIYIISTLFPGQFTGGLSITPALLTCSYAGMAALWLASMLLHGLPISLERLVMSRAPAQQEPPGMDAPPAAEPHPAAKLRPEHAAALTTALAPGEELLCSHRPHADITNRYARADVIRGNILGALALFAFLTGLSSYTSYLLKHEALYLGVCAACGVLALLLCGGAWGKLRSPARWQSALRATSYAITTRRIFIFEGAGLRTFELSPALHISYEPLSTPGFGIIRITTAGSPTRSPEPTQPLPGLFHIPATLHPFLTALCKAVSESEAAHTPPPPGAQDK